MLDAINDDKSVLDFKKRLVKEIPYVPKSDEAREWLLSIDVGELLHIYHFWRQRFIEPVIRKFHAPPAVRNEPFYVRNKEKVNLLRGLVEAGANLDLYLSRAVHGRALDVNKFKEEKSFNSSRDTLLVCEGFYHLHLEPLPRRTDELLVVHVTREVVEVVGLFTHDLFDDNTLNPNYIKYDNAVKSYMSRKFPEGGMILGGAGGGMQNAAGSSIASTIWQIHCRKTMQRALKHVDGLDGFAIELYANLFKRQAKFVSAKWDLTKDGRLLIVEKKNKHQFWMNPRGEWNGEAFSKD